MTEQAAFTERLDEAVLAGRVFLPDGRTRLLRARSRLGTSQRELAELLDIPVLAIQQMEQGHKPRDPERRRVIARFIYWSESTENGNGR